MVAQNRESLIVMIQGQLGISPAERDRIQREGEKPENQKRLEELIRLHGEYKKVVDQETGVAYRVLTKDIITKGLRQEDLSQYPVWKDG